MTGVMSQFRFGGMMHAQPEEVPAMHMQRGHSVIFKMVVQYELMCMHVATDMSMIVAKKQPWQDCRW